MFRSEPVVDLPSVLVSLVKELQANDSDTYDKEIYLSEHALRKSASSMTKISKF
jgi:hypothetical protein